MASTLPPIGPFLPFRAMWDYLRGADLKALAPAAPIPQPPEVKHRTSTPDSYANGLADLLSPTVVQAFGGNPYTLNSAIFACLQVLAKAFQEAPLRVYRALADGTDEWLDEHPLMQLLDDPHPSLSQPECNWWLCSCLNVQGNAYLRKIRGLGGGVVQLWPVSPTNMHPEPTADDQQRAVFISQHVSADRP